jgi:ech hydrogenase subunit F
MPWMIPRLIKNLLSGPATRRYPFEKRTPFADARGALVHDKDKCDLCGDCVRLCPAAAIVMDEQQKSLTYNPYRCIYCRLCAESCQHGAVTATTTHQPPGQQVEALPWKR